MRARLNQNPISTSPSCAAGVLAKGAIHLSTLLRWLSDKLGSKTVDFLKEKKGKRFVQPQIVAQSCYSIQYSTAQ